jgi:hypothetical protein
MKKNFFFFFFFFEKFFCWCSAVGHLGTGDRRFDVDDITVCQKIYNNAFKPSSICVLFRNISVAMLSGTIPTQIGRLTSLASLCVNTGTSERFCCAFDVDSSPIATQ